MADTQTEVQVIELDGTRVDTLWTTVESGKLDDGTKYEKRQRTAPRTLEEAVQDKNGTLLPTKLTAMQEQLNGVSTEIGTTIDEAITQRAGEDIATKEDIKNTPGDNLLKNSNFKINTNGLTEYTGTGMSVNEWTIGNNGTITVNDDGITIKSSTWIFQVVPSIANTTFTASVELSDGTRLEGTVMTDDLSADKVYSMGSNDNFRFYLQNWLSVNQLRFIIISTNDVSIKHAKLELGSLATEYIEPDIEIERVRCGVANADTLDGRHASDFLLQGNTVKVNRIGDTDIKISSWCDRTTSLPITALDFAKDDGTVVRYQILSGKKDITIFNYDGTDWKPLGTILADCLPLTGGTMKGGIDFMYNNVLTGTIRPNANGLFQIIARNSDNTLTRVLSLSTSDSFSDCLKVGTTKVLHAGNSKPVAIDSTAPTDTSALWYNPSTKTLKSYKDGAWQ